MIATISACSALCSCALGGERLNVLEKRHLQLCRLHRCLGGGKPNRQIEARRDIGARDVDQLAIDRHRAELGRPERELDALK
ncbi:MAG: hypothetical protein WA717_09275, partial [Methyloceanibacter sp.]